MKLSAQPGTPILRSFDERQTREFYLGFLGFEVLFEHRFTPDAPLYLGIRLDACELHLSEHFGDACPGAAVRIEVRDLADYQRWLLAKQYRHARPGAPERTDWGTLELVIRDPAGNKLIFCERLPASPGSTPARED